MLREDLPQGAGALSFCVFILDIKLHEGTQNVPHLPGAWSVLEESTF